MVVLDREFWVWSGLPETLSDPFWSLDYKIETRLRNRTSITQSRLDCVIDPLMSRSSKTRYRGRFRSSFLSGLPETLSDPC